MAFAQLLVIDVAGLKRYCRHVHRNPYGKYRTTLIKRSGNEAHVVRYR